MLKSRSMTALDGGRDYSSTRGLFASDGFDLFQSLAAASQQTDESDFSGQVCNVSLSVTPDGFIAVETEMLRVRTCWTVYKRSEEFLRLFRSLRVDCTPPMGVERIGAQLSDLVHSDALFSSVSLQQFIDNQYSTLAQEITIRTLHRQLHALPPAPQQPPTPPEEPSFGIGLDLAEDNDVEAPQATRAHEPVALTPDGVLLVLRNAEPSSVVGQVYEHCKHRLQALQPNDAAFRQRGDLNGMMKKVLKAALGAPAHGIGSVPLGAFLPENANELSVFVNAAQEKLWFTSVTDALCRLAAAERDGGELLGEMKLDEDEESVRMWAQGIEEIRFVPRTRTVVCEVAGTSVEIHANRIDELCKLGLFEQIDRTLGAKHVFKRSLLMIKAFIR